MGAGILRSGFLRRLEIKCPKKPIKLGLGDRSLKSLGCVLGFSTIGSVRENECERHSYMRWGLADTPPSLRASCRTCRSKVSTQNWRHKGCAPKTLPQGQILKFSSARQKSPVRGFLWQTKDNFFPVSRNSHRFTKTKPASFFFLAGRPFFLVARPLPRRCAIK